MNGSIEQDVSHLNANHLDLKHLEKILALALNPLDIIEVQDHIIKSSKRRISNLEMKSRV
ncbi:MAG: hypothetical protein NTY37_07830 [Methanothrix sp.]|nr:hypothetical protein [Methanothrix sp.]